MRNLSCNFIAVSSSVSPTSNLSRKGESLNEISFCNLTNEMQDNITLEVQNQRLLVPPLPLSDPETSPRHS